jgi:hypothetical protein
VESASIPAGWGLAVSDVERVSRDLSYSWTLGLFAPAIRDVVWKVEMWSNPCGQCEDLPELGTMHSAPRFEP